MGFSAAFGQPFFVLCDLFGGVDRSLVTQIIAAKVLNGKTLI